MPLTLIYTDFDGTLTGQDGETTTSSDFYQSLFNVSAAGGPQQAELKAPEVLNHLFKKHFGEDGKDSEMLISPQAIDYLKASLSDPDVRLHIVSRNIGDYIRALEKYQEFTAAEIERLTILDARCVPQVSAGKNLNLKYTLVEQHVKQNYKSADIKIGRAYVFDDNRVDCQAMSDALRACDIEPTMIHTFAGGFDWKIYQDALACPPVLSRPSLAAQGVSQVGSANTTPGQLSPTPFFPLNMSRSLMMSKRSARSSFMQSEPSSVDATADNAEDAAARPKNP